jgi:hypothetical protein
MCGVGYTYVYIYIHIWLVVSNMAGLFSISYMGCHPSHWLSLHDFSEVGIPPTRYMLCLQKWFPFHHHPSKFGRGVSVSLRRCMVMPLSMWKEVARPRARSMTLCCWMGQVHFGVRCEYCVESFVDVNFWEVSSIDFNWGAVWEQIITIWGGHPS